MCASYGLDGSGKIIPTPGGEDPFSEIVRGPLIDGWVDEFSGIAKITGKHDRNMNPVVRADGDGLRADLAWWAIWFNGTGPAGRFAFNARDDKLMRSWKGPFQRRALLPATWYIEGKKRWTLPDGDRFWIAAITSTVTEDATGKELLTYSMVTRNGIGEAASVISAHGESRMPLILPQSMHADWLDPERPGDAELVGHVQLASEEISRAMTAA